MIVWINATFGGPTTVAPLPTARVLDPEHVGFMLAANLGDHRVDDFQHWPPWRQLVIATALQLAAYTGQDLICPQRPCGRPAGDHAGSPGRRWWPRGRTHHVSREEREAWWRGAVRARRFVVASLVGQGWCQPGRVRGTREVSAEPGLPTDRAQVWPVAT